MAGVTRTLFISTQYLRDNSIINDNVDHNVLQPLIVLTQDKIIQQTLGTPLYEKMIQLVDAANPAITGSVPITGNYKILLEDYIIPTLVQFSIYEAIPFMNYKFRNKAISKQASDNSTPADLTELYYIRDNVLSTAQFYAERMSVYLCHNSNSFPEYHAPSNDMCPDPNNSFNGIHIPRKRYNKGWDEKNGIRY